MKLILTASVIANSPVVRRDPRVRMLDYRSSLALWLMYGPFTRVEIVEGSGTPIVTAELSALARSRGVALTESVLDVGPVASAHGKGRAEAYLLRHGLRDLSGEACFAKATGRLFVPNARAIAVETCRGGRALFLNHGTTDTRFFVANVGWFSRTVEPRTDEIDDRAERTYIEAVYERCGGWEPLAERPAYYGISATTGELL